MSYKINPKELESCMIELFAESSWSRYRLEPPEETHNYIQFDGHYLTTDGQIIIFSPTHFTDKSKKDGQLWKEYGKLLFEIVDESIFEYVWLALGTLRNYKNGTLEEWYDDDRVKPVIEQNSGESNDGDLLMLRMRERTYDKGFGVDTGNMLIGTHSMLVGWSLCLYLSRHYKEDILKPNGKTSLHITKEILWSYLGHGIGRPIWFENHLNLRKSRPNMRIDSIHEEHLFLERTGICRIRGISLVRECVFENGVWMNVDVGVNKFIQGGHFINDTHPSQQELNIETFYPLTSEQRRILKDFIDRYHIPLDKIFIDDHSEEQSVKRQLGIGSIVQQFHR